MSWLMLSVAGLLEIVWALGLKLSAGFTRPWIVLMTLLAMVASFALLGLAMRQLPVGTAYAVWTGIGALGTALAGMLWLGDATSPGRVISLLLIFIGIIGLKLSSSA
ncbi:DMT family transporter [Alkalilimnicola sp. S0819]|uniref:DMT family transporter n=1 Tax=Alkalilimnicola sp. S0819 TaxID=2613922 RepID=UPI001262769F|nr:multidrug efflux SMR transporter [Alkalilimnicola sp. S0819]KAB7627868.1 multidrug efflux SMR transporter [Alkalilimnicola sp. S0819]MPQ15503.1 QacE family quaternary ammonium compound efflux SMR transporter [Alkalilimnicola sp. S0819]